MSPLAEKLADLEQLSNPALKAEWRRLFRSPVPSLSRDLLQRAIAHRYQEMALGGLSKASARKLRTLAADQSGSKSPTTRVSQPVILPGARLVREWHGRTHCVTVTETGFDYAGRNYRSLTQIAKEITGAHWSGPRFFGLQKQISTGGRKPAAGSVMAAAGLGPGAAEGIHHG